MAARRPLVHGSGFPRELPAGDTLLGVPLGVLVYMRAGGTLRVSLNNNQMLPVALAAGGSLSVPVVTNG
ncbi:hypothetical protein [Pseudomonas phage KPP25]|uniref:Uncharacterized protein n=1 Tax=Pseudomonas phage KPP25 TaxID=1462608 RepID=X5IES8_BPKP2|nr:hypothetical protein FF13_gp85 [Pseudomonas phage KPP25]UCR75646.1 hypothetical protein PAER4900a_00084 [Pseudomonas phage YMC17/07/R4900a]BAO58557.1 hypothetical protein [Pseudomonas phage KPP25]